MSVPSASAAMASCDWPRVAEAGRLVPAPVCPVCVSTVTRVNSWAASETPPGASVTCAPAVPGKRPPSASILRKWVPV